MEIIFKGRQTDVATRFRDQAMVKLSRLERLDQKAIRVDVEVSVERNPRLASQKERVELTIISRGPAIRAEAAAEDRFAALDLALAKLDSRLRRALDRRKRRHASHGLDRISDRVGPDQQVAPDGALGPADGLTEEPAEDLAPVSARGRRSGAARASARGGASSPSVPRQGTSPDPLSFDGRARDELPPDELSPDGLSAGEDTSSLVPIDMDGDGPLVVRQKFHHAVPITIDQALLEMELVGHDFYLFHDIDEDMPSVVYRRRGYQYGVIRLVEAATAMAGPARQTASARARGRSGSSASGADGLADGLVRQDRATSVTRSG
jgi:ribosomal subunit interface protein